MLYVLPRREIVWKSFSETIHPGSLCMALNRLRWYWHRATFSLPKQNCVAKGLHPVWTFTVFSLSTCLHHAHVSVQLKDETCKGKESRETTKQAQDIHVDLMVYKTRRSGFSVLIARLTQLPYTICQLQYTIYSIQYTIWTIAEFCCWDTKKASWPRKSASQASCAACKNHLSHHGAEELGCGGAPTLLGSAGFPKASLSLARRALSCQHGR